ncbi:MAG: malto-oligosyltrehalose trehalohydrolase [Acidimicrobiia bacterium]
MTWSAEHSRARVWAPHADRVELQWSTAAQLTPLEPKEQGWFEADLEDVAPGDRYVVRLDGGAGLPDPASLSQPDGVHGPSQVVDLSLNWTDDEWRNPPLHEHVIYELHVGTFTPAGTFDGVIDRLAHLVDLGVTAVELMPVAQFPGTRNWGYDGVDLYAVQNSYGGPHGLARLVDACHGAGLAVILDVVYNHLGPEGNYLRQFGPYFTDRYQTPWGEAVNLDGPGSDHVRSFLLENALLWTEQFHVDGLRLDAVHAMFDRSARPFLRELADSVHSRTESQDRQVYLIAESSSNDPTLVEARAVGGQDLAAAWNDDFHHALHVTLTGETARYYADFADPVEDLATGISDGYIISGRYSAYRGRRHGASSRHLPRSSLVVFAQNHDQIGNRAQGERLSILVDPARQRFAAAVTLLSPWVPMLFQGEEWGETRPFAYFIDHGDDALSLAVRQGRSQEFAGFIAPGEEVPDPAAPSTFENSKLDWDSIAHQEHRPTLELHKALISVRHRHHALADPDPASHTASRTGSVITVESSAGNQRVVTVCNAAAQRGTGRLPPGRWRRLIDTSDRQFGGGGSRTPASCDGGEFDLDPWGCVAYEETHP